MCFCVSVYMCVFRNGEGDYVHMSYLLLFILFILCACVCAKTPAGPANIYL